MSTVETIGTALLIKKINIAAALSSIYDNQNKYYTHLQKTLEILSIFLCVKFDFLKRRLMAIFNITLSFSFPSIF